MALEEYSFDNSLQVASSMDATCYDQIFISRPMADDIWYGYSNCFNIVSDYRAMEEANKLLSAASLPPLDTGFTAGNSMFNGAEIPASGIYGTPHAANVHGENSSFFENYGDYRSSTWFDLDGSGHNCGVFGRVKEGCDVMYDEAVLNQEAIGPLCSTLSLQNELELMCRNVNDVTMQQNISKSATGESCDNRGCFSPYENKSPATLLNTENVILTLLSEEKTSMEPLEFDSPPRRLNNDNMDDLFSERTEAHSAGQQQSWSSRDCRNGVMINHNITESRVMVTDRQDDDKPLTQKTAVMNAGGRNNLTSCKDGSESNLREVAVGGKKGKGQPAKNLLAERRRRKRLNDRLCMLRSVVPTISKMDRTTILSDTIEYTKQLLHRIRYLHKEMEPQTEWPAHLRAHGGYFSSVPDQYFADKTIPKFEVHRNEGWQLNIHMACQANPNLLRSTVSTLESFGLEIQEGIFSCFGDFKMQAQCSETEKYKRNTRPEDIKIALLQKTGYLGKNNQCV